MKLFVLEKRMQGIVMSGRFDRDKAREHLTQFYDSVSSRSMAADFHDPLFTVQTIIFIASAFCTRSVTPVPSRKGFLGDLVTELP